MRFQSPSYAHATLTTQQVQEVRALGSAGLTAKSIAAAYSVCERTVINIFKTRQWAWLPVVDVPLPLLNRQRATCLRLGKVKRLSAAQRQAIAEYRKRLAAHIDAEAEREGVAVTKLNTWTAPIRNESNRSSYEYVLPDHYRQAAATPTTAETQPNADAGGTSAYAVANAGGKTEVARHPEGAGSNFRVIAPKTGLLSAFFAVRFFGPEFYPLEAQKRGSDAARAICGCFRRSQ